MASSTASHTGTRGGVVVDGLDEIVTMFTREVETTRARAALVVVDHAGRAAERMRSTVAVDQGDVLDSIDHDTRATHDGATVYSDAGPNPLLNKAAFVGRFLEHGTVHMPPQPFVGPAGDRQAEPFAEDMRKLPKL